MSLDVNLHKQLAAVLEAVDEHGTTGPRLKDDAERLWRQVKQLVEMRLIAPDFEMNPLELACGALQLPLRNRTALPVGKLGAMSLGDRAEQSAELLLGLLGEQIDETLLDQTTRLLREVPQRSPMLDEARLLADAVNLEDFGIVGLLLQIVQLARQGDGIVQLARGCRKREQYGYWEARLKEGFHFEPVRKMAARRLEHTRKLCNRLWEELGEA